MKGLGEENAAAGQAGERGGEFEFRQGERVAQVEEAVHVGVGESAEKLGRPRF